MGNADGSTHTRLEFAELVRPGAPEPPLDRAALLVACEEYPDLVIEASLAELDRMAAEVGRRIGHELDPYLIVGALNRHLFEEVGFRGNKDSYYDPRNSFLNQVIERRLGIPITLGMVYMEVARRLELPVRGVNMPGHFLVAYDAADERLLIDCFDGGNIVLESGTQAFLDRLFHGRVKFQPEYIEPVSNRAILSRVLSNLKIVYAQRRDLRRAVWISDLLLVINPTSPWEYRDRGLLHFQLSQLASAEPDLQKYLELKPEAPDAEQVRRVMREIRRRRDQPA